MKSLTTAWTGQPYTVSASALEGLVNGAAAQVSARYKLLYKDALTPVPIGSYGPYNDDGDITRYVVSGTHSVDTTQDGVGKYTLQLRESASLPFDPRLHAIQVFCDLWMAGQIVADVPVGVFWSALPDRTLDDIWIEDAVQLVDITGRGGTLVAMAPYVATAGTAYTTAAQTLLTMSAMPLSLGGTGQTTAGKDFVGFNIPLSRISIPPSALALPVDQTLKYGDKLYSTLNTWMDAINYLHFWGDAIGGIKTGAEPDWTLGSPTIAWTYTDGPTGVIAPGATLKNNAANQANAVVVLGANSSSSQIVAGPVYNTNPASRISVGNLNDTVVPLVISDSKIPDQATANTRAHLELQAAAGQAETLTITVPPNPFLDPYDVLAVTLHAPDGSVAVSSDVGWQLTGWALDLHQLTMSLTLTKALLV